MNHSRIFFLPGCDSAAENAPEGLFDGVISMENSVDSLKILLTK